MKKLAKIRKASLEIQERGILNFWIHVDYEEGTSQGVGGIALDAPHEGGREGTAYGCELIRCLLIEMGVNDFSEMKGKIIWVLQKEEHPSGIQALRVDGGTKEGVVFADVLERTT